MANLADQLGWCITSKDHLKNLSDAISISQSNLENIILALQHTGFSEYNQWLLPLKEQFYNGATETQTFINNRHINYLDDRVKFISGKLDELN